MSSNVVEAFFILFPYLVILAFLFVFPALLCKGLWKLNVKGPNKSYKDLYNAVSNFTAAAFTIFLLIKVLVRTWKG